MGTFFVYFAKLFLTSYFEVRNNYKKLYIFVPIYKHFLRKNTFTIKVNTFYDLSIHGYETKVVIFV